jgi:hypothetical protein
VPRIAHASMSRPSAGAWSTALGTGSACRARSRAQPRPGPGPRPRTGAGRTCRASASVTGPAAGASSATPGRAARWSRAPLPSAEHRAGRRRRSVPTTPGRGEPQRDGRRSRRAFAARRPRPWPYGTWGCRRLSFAKARPEPSAICSLSRLTAGVPERPQPTRDATATYRREGGALRSCGRPPGCCPSRAGEGQTRTTRLSRLPVANASIVPHSPWRQWGRFGSSRRGQMKASFSPQRFRRGTTPPPAGCPLRSGRHPPTLASDPVGPTGSSPDPPVPRWPCPVPRRPPRVRPLFHDLTEGLSPFPRPRRRICPLGDRASPRRKFGGGCEIRGSRGA